MKKMLWIGLSTAAALTLLSAALFFRASGESPVSIDSPGTGITETTSVDLHAVTPTCTMTGGAVMNPFGAAKGDCVEPTASSDIVPDLVRLEDVAKTNAAASQQIIDMVQTSRDKTAEASKVLRQASRCNEDRKLSDYEECDAIRGAQAKVASNMLQYAASGDVAAKFELARIIIKEEMSRDAGRSSLLMAIENPVPKDPEYWHSRALLLIKEASDQGYGPAIEQSSRISRGEGFLVN